MAPTSTPPDSRILSTFVDHHTIFSRRQSPSSSPPPPLIGHPGQSFGALMGFILLGVILSIALLLVLLLWWIRRCEHKKVEKEIREAEGVKVLRETSAQMYARQRESIELGTIGKQPQTQGVVRGNGTPALEEIDIVDGKY